MHHSVHPDIGTSTIWLTRSEAADPSVQPALNQLIDHTRSCGSHTAVFISGDLDLYTQTSALLCQNAKQR